MNKYNRYFEFKSGPLVDAIVAANKQNNESKDQIRLIQSEIGAKTSYVGNKVRFVAFLFPSDPDPKAYRKLHGGFYPKKRTPLFDRLSALKWTDPDDCLKLIGLPNAPTLFGASKAYFPHCVLLPREEPVVYVTVPWYDEDPQVLEAYKRDRSAGNSFSSNYDAVLWQPPEDSTEIKSWQFEKAIDDWNESLKEKA